MPPTGATFAGITRNDTSLKAKSNRLDNLLLALGFRGLRGWMTEQLGLKLDSRDNAFADQHQMTSIQDSLAQATCAAASPSSFG